MVHCGLKAPPEGEKRGTAKQCIDKGQVRYYGLKDIDKKLLDIPNIEKMRKEPFELKITISALEKRFEKEKDVYKRVREKRKGDKSKEAQADIKMRRYAVKKTIKQHDRAQKKLKKLREEYAEIKKKNNII